MTLPKRVIGILGVIHVLFVTYTILVVSFFFASSPAVMRNAFSPLTQLIETYGIAGYLLPLLWTTLTAYYLCKLDVPRSAATIAFSIWVIITALLLGCAILVTASAVR